MNSPGIWQRQMELRAEDNLLIGAIQGKIGKDQYEIQKGQTKDCHGNWNMVV